MCCPALHRKGRAGLTIEHEQFEERPLQVHPQGKEPAKSYRLPKRKKVWRPCQAASAAKGARQMGGRPLRFTMEALNPSITQGAPMENEEFERRLTGIVRKENARFEAALQEQSARIGVLRFLLEQVFANQFIDAPEAFEEFMLQTLEKIRARPSLVEPTPEEAVIEMQALMAAHADRFRVDVLRRIEQASG
jgi:hypothetical protein